MTLEQSVNGQKGQLQPLSEVRGDELSGEVAIRAKLDQTGLTAEAKSRAVAAADRLLGGLLGIGAAYVEGIRTGTEIKQNIQADLMRADGARALVLLQSMDETGKATARRFIAEETRKQINREAIWTRTENAFSSLPPSGSIDTPNSNPELEEDWMNIFVSYAEKASSKGLQQLWAKILSGEIRRPGSFAVSTLRVLSEIGAKTALAFQDVVKLRIREDCVLKPGLLSGDELIKWKLLEESGLLQDINGPLSFKFSVEELENPCFVGNTYYLKIRPTDNNIDVFIPVDRCIYTCRSNH